MTQENSDHADNGHADGPQAASARSSARWHWLQQRLESTATLDDWFEAQLEALEEDFSDLVTPKSRSRSIHRDR